MDAILDEVVASTEKLRGDNHDGGGAVSDLVVLELGKIDEDAGGGVLNLKLGEDGGAIVRDEDVANVVDEHLVKADGAEGGLDDVGHSQGGSDVADANILSSLALSVEELKANEEKVH